MPNRLIHLIYSSAAARHFTDTEIMELLRQSREKNARMGITGMLLYDNGSFFQVLEGTAAAVDELFQAIAHDQRHSKAVVIIREPIMKRAFNEWTMGYAHMKPQELGEMTGLNDFFTEGASFTQLNAGRAKKVLAAFREGRWRSKLKLSDTSDSSTLGKVQAKPAVMAISKVSFAFQPIINTDIREVVAYEALVRSVAGDALMFDQAGMNDVDLANVDTSGRALAISLAATLGLPCDLHLNFLARHVDDVHAAIEATINAAERSGIDVNRLVLEIDQDKLIGDFEHFVKIINEYRWAALRITIDHFGAGKAGLNLLEPLRPNMISLNPQLVRGIDVNGARQAIVRGVLQTCQDLGIDLIAKHVETLEEYQWLCDEGVSLFQGDLIAQPAFEKLPSAYFP